MVQNKFLNFLSWSEIAYDVAASIDYILVKTNQTKLTYVGHSQGGTVIAALLSERPEYNGKISSVHLIASAIYLKYYNHMLEPFLKNLNEIKVRIVIQPNNNDIKNKFEPVNHFVNYRMTVPVLKTVPVAIPVKRAVW